MFAYITHMRAKPGKRDELMRLNRTMQDATAREAEVPIYAFHTAEDDPDAFWFYDLYLSQEAFDAHCATPAYQNMASSFGELADVVAVTKLIPFGPVKSEPVSEAHQS